MDVMLGKIISECDSKYVILRGRVEKQRENIKKKKTLGKKSVKRANIFLKSKLSKVVFVLIEEVLWQERFNKGYYTMDIEFSLKAPQWDIPTSC